MILFAIVLCMPVWLFFVQFDYIMCKFRTVLCYLCIYFLGLEFVVSTAGLGMYQNFDKGLNQNFERVRDYETYY